MRFMSALLMAASALVIVVFSFCQASSNQSSAKGQAAKNNDVQLQSEQVLKQFSEQFFHPCGGYVFRPGPLPKLQWENAELMVELPGSDDITTRWFNEDFEEVSEARTPGRYYAYGNAESPTGKAFAYALTCCCVDRDIDLSQLADELANSPNEEVQMLLTKATVESWRKSESGAVALSAILEARSEGKSLKVRPGQWAMENATRHVQLKRKIMGINVPPITILPRLHGQADAPVLHRTEHIAMTVAACEVISALDAWHKASPEPMSIIVAHRGRVLVEKAYGQWQGKPTTVWTPLPLASVMKPIMGVKLAMYLDRGHVSLDDPIGRYLPAFSSPRDQDMTLRACFIHATGIDYPHSLLYSRPFYFRTWQDNLIAHRPREWDPGKRQRYGAVGIILVMRALELQTGKNYSHSMEDELLRPLGMCNISPGCVEASAEDIARLGVLLANRGRYGPYEFFSEKTFDLIKPTPPTAFFPEMIETDSIGLYGIGLHDMGPELHAFTLGPGSIGHGGGFGAQLIIQPQRQFVLSLLRSDRGEQYDQQLKNVLAAVRELVPLSAN